MQGMPQQQAEIQDQQNPKKVKGKRYNGLLEWIMDRDGHEFLVDVDREFIRDKFNYHGLREKFIDELNISPENMSERQFQIYIKHLYKAAAPTQENLQDEKYLQFIQDAVDVYGLIHNRYVRTDEGKFLFLSLILNFYS